MKIQMYRIGAGLLSVVFVAQSSLAGSMVACRASGSDGLVFEAYLQTGDAADEIEQQGCGGESGAFLMGVQQGLAGERFGFFYPGTTDISKDREFLRNHYACSEFGVPVEQDGSMARFDSLLQKSMFTKYFMEPIGSMLMEVGTAILNSVKYAWEKLTGSKKTVTKLKEELKKAEMKAAKERSQPELKRIPAAEARKAPAEGGSAKDYACCMRGFMQGAGILSALIKKTGNQDCSEFASRCKTYFDNGVRKAALACQPENPDSCSTCDIKRIDAETEPNKEKEKSLLGCASIGYINELRSSSVCQDAMARQRQAQSAKVNLDSTKSVAAEAPAGTQVSSEPVVKPAN